MLSDHGEHRISYIFLCATPFLVMIIAAARPLRIQGVYQSVGGIQFVLISLAAWKLGARTIRSEVQSRRSLGLAGMLLVTPFALVALLWVGIGGPWAATASENEMRYLVLIVMAAAVVGGFVVLKDVLGEAGERFYSRLAFAAIMLAGPLYLVWDTFVFGLYFAQEHTGEVPPAIASLHPFQDVLLSLAGAFTYVSTAAFAASLAHPGWLDRKASSAYVIVNFVALIFIVIKVQQHPDATALSPPWFTIPGFILGVPAFPLIMPFLLGVVLLRRAGNEQNWGATK
jgi:hypothetical protein